MIRALLGGKKRQKLQPDQRWPGDLLNGDVLRDVRGPLIVYAREPQHDGSVKVWAINRNTRERVVWTIGKDYVLTLDLTLMTKLEDVLLNAKVLEESIQEREGRWLT